MVSWGAQREPAWTLSPAYQEEGGPARLVQGLDSCLHQLGGLVQLLPVLLDEGLNEAQLLFLLLRDPLQQLTFLLVQNGIQSVKLLAQLFLYLVTVLLRREAPQSPSFPGQVCPGASNLKPI